MCVQIQKTLATMNDQTTMDRWLKKCMFVSIGTTSVVESLSQERMSVSVEGQIWRGECRKWRTAPHAATPTQRIRWWRLAKWTYCRKRSGSIQQSLMTTIDTPSPPQSVVNMDMRGGNINNIGRDVHNHVHNHSVTISIRFVWLNTVIYKCDADRNMIQWRQHDSVSQRGSKLAVFTDDTRSILVIFWIDGRVRRGSTVFVTLHFTRLSHGFKLVSNLHDWVPGVWNSTHIISHAPLLTCQGAWYYYLTWS